MQNYPIGTPGSVWGNAEKQQWFQAQFPKRLYQEEVLDKLSKVSNKFTRHQYGILPYSALGYDAKDYTLFAFSSSNMDSSKRTILVTGGVHGYETSGVQGAIAFLLENAESYSDEFNFIIAPCISPWGYETINRWNPDTIDPNRSFYPDSPALEAKLIMDFVAGIDSPIYAHIDLHETTDTDDTEFRPALAAKNGTEFKDWGIPDGFYTVADTNNKQLDFQKAIIDSVKTVTHIAPPDADNKIIGAEVEQEGVICYDKKSLFLCAGFTDAMFVSTTEVYPDSPRSTAENCIDAQVAALLGAFDYLRQHHA